MKNSPLIPGIPGSPRLLYRAVVILLAFTICAAPEGQNTDTKALCKRNLRLIHDAIQAYRAANQDLPGWLSELLPKYLADPEVLFCPESKRKAMTSVAATGRRAYTDTRTSYFYEFSNVPLEDVPGRTNRDWKRAQMGQLGSVVPIVRCLVHDRAINLSFGGEIYESGIDWEYKFTNLVQYAHLVDRFLLAPPPPVRTVQIPARPAIATTTELDLSELYNGSLAKSWVASEPGHLFGALQAGLRQLDGVRFDIRGVIQLSSRGLLRRGEAFPEHVIIPVTQNCAEVHFLIGGSEPGKNGTEAGRFKFEFSDDQSDALPLLIGTHLRASWQEAENDPALSEAAVAWRAPTLFHVKWTNSRPNVQLRSIEAVGGTDMADFFIVAVSMKP